MSIKSYEKNGKTMYQIYVSVRSTVQKVRVQKLKKDILTMAEARREEGKLLKACYEEIGRIEGRGYLWKEIINRWVIQMRNKRYGKKYSREYIIDVENTLFLHNELWLIKRTGEISRADGRRLIDTLFNSGLSISRIKTIKGFINRVYTWGIEEGLISDAKNSPVQGMELPKEVKNMKPILTTDEIKLLMHEAFERDHTWKYVWAVAILTGMRSGEMYALKWSDVDLVNNIFRITKSFSQRLRAIKTTKNSDWRNGHISSELKEVFIALKNLRGDEEFVLPRLAGWEHGMAGEILRTFLRSIGIEKYVNFHTLRACFATHVLASGAEPTQVMKMGGWADFKTFQIYIRMAGIDVKGVTDNFTVMPKVIGLDNLVKIR
jgi:integrase